MKWIQLILIIPINLNAYRQLNSGEVIYKAVKIAEFNEHMDNEAVQSLAKMVVEISQEFIYKLSFNDNESVFKMLPIMTIREKDMYFRSAKMVLGGDNIHYLNKKKGVLITQKSSLGGKFLIPDATLAAYQAAMLISKAISTHEQEYDAWITAYDNCGGGYDQHPVYI